VLATRLARKKPSPYKIGHMGGRFVGGSRNNIIVRVCLHDVAQRGGQNKKIAQRSGTPQGRRHAATSADLSIPTRKGGLKRARVGGGCIAMITSMRGGEVKRDLISREQKVCVTWNLCLNFF